MPDMRREGESVMPEKPARLIRISVATGKYYALQPYGGEVFMAVEHWLGGTQALDVSSKGYPQTIENNTTVYRRSGFGDTGTCERCGR